MERPFKRITPRSLVAQWIVTDVAWVSAVAQVQCGFSPWPGELLHATDTAKKKKKTSRYLGFIIYIFSISEDLKKISFRYFLNSSILVIQLTKQSNPTFDPVLSRLVCF